jgi:DNA-binding NarL/FixJ family response regulator
VYGARDACEYRDICGETSNGEEAIEKTLQTNPDWIIMDVCVPKVDSFSAAKQIKKILPTVPIIIQAAQEAGAQGFVTKSELPPLC